MGMSGYKGNKLCTSLDENKKQTEGANGRVIQIFNQHATLPESGQFGRHYFFSKYLKRAGYDPVVFAGSNPHNTEMQLVKSKALYQTSQYEGFSFVLVKTCVYDGSKFMRILAMLQYFLRLFAVTRQFDKPQVIIGSSVHPLACVAAIKLAKKHRCKSIVEIRDLWPESIVTYGIKSRSSLIIRLLYKLEKWIYTKADAIIFTMEGGKDYIVEKGWDKEHGGSIDLTKVYQINNGVDLELFDYNQKNHVLSDIDLDDPNTFKVIYTGSIRLVNQVETIVDVATYLSDLENNNIRFLIYGDGNERAKLELECKKRKLNNIIFKGHVDKKYIPYITSRASLNLMQYGSTPILRYGASMNKSFEYLAAGKPIVGNIAPKYDYIESNGCGIMREFHSAKEYADAILKVANMPQSEYLVMCENAKMTAKQYDFRVLTEKLITVIKNI
jgi:glycosyltransferase involved in cell wall biosynthesis